MESFDKEVGVFSNNNSSSFDDKTKKLFRKGDKSIVEKSQLFLTCIDYCLRYETLKVKVSKDLLEVAKEITMLMNDVVGEVYCHHLSQNKIVDLASKNMAEIEEVIILVESDSKVLEEGDDV